jgi:Asp-tRNA(Asn)/Glu-tRNA(Gln) amidotransferase A subunit family amidase
VFGYKPSFGLVPRTAMLKTTDTLDTVGFIARSVADLRLMFEACRVRGHNYPIAESALANASRQTTGGRRWRVGLVQGPKTSYESKAVRGGVERFAARLSAAGCDVFEYRLPHAFDEAHDIHERIYRRAVAYYFKIEWESNAALFSPVMRDMIRSGGTIAPGQYQADLRRQSELARLFDEESAKFDVLVGVSTADEAPVGLEAPDLPDHCLIWTMVGAPSLSLPLLSGTTGLPVGVQVVSRKYSDYKLLDFADLAVRVAA